MLKQKQIKGQIGTLDAKDVLGELETMGENLMTGESLNFGCARFRLFRSFHDGELCIVDTGDADSLLPLSETTLRCDVGVMRRKGTLFAIE